MTVEGGNFFFPTGHTRRKCSEHLGQAATAKATRTMLSAIQLGRTAANVPDSYEAKERAEGERPSGVGPNTG